MLPPQGKAYYLPCGTISLLEIAKSTFTFLLATQWQKIHKKSRTICSNKPLIQRLLNRQFFHMPSTSVTRSAHLQTQRITAENSQVGQPHSKRSSVQSAMGKIAKGLKGTLPSSFPKQVDKNNIYKQREKIRYCLAKEKPATLSKFGNLLIGKSAKAGLAEKQRQLESAVKEASWNVAGRRYDIDSRSLLLTSVLNEQEDYESDDSRITDREISYSSSTNASSDDYNHTFCGFELPSFLNQRDDMSTVGTKSLTSPSSTFDGEGICRDLGRMFMESIFFAGPAHDKEEDRTLNSSPIENLTIIGLDKRIDKKEGKDQSIEVLDKAHVAQSTEVIEKENGNQSHEVGEKDERGQSSEVVKQDHNDSKIVPTKTDSDVGKVWANPVSLPKIKMAINFNMVFDIEP